MIARHPRVLPSVVVAGFAGFGITAFGIAPLAPDAARLTQSVISHVVPLEGLDRQAEALALHEFELTRNEVSRLGDTAESLLARLSVTDAPASSFLRRDPVARQVLEGRGGKRVAARTDRQGRLIELVARFPAARSDQFDSHFSRLTVRAVAGGFEAQVENVPLEVKVRLGSGTIQSSLFAATDAAGLPDAVASQVAEMFSSEIDFHRELRKGDTFSVVYEALTADGEAISWNQGTGQVLAAEFVNAGRSYSAMWYAGAQGKGGYYDFKGNSLRRAFLASPMAFSRVTSGFAMRFHPILKTWRKHQGIDYGAPTGAPVRTVGDGVVVFAGRQNGYGNVIKVDHGGQRETLYAHLSRIHVRKGQRVEQGATIGAVGSTGWATGPHLHFEFKVAGEPKNPQLIARAATTVALDAAAQREFAVLSPIMRRQLDMAQSIDGALN